MRLAISIARTALVAALALTFGACNDKRSDDVLAQDTSLTKDLALANRDTASQPQLKDVPVEATPAPVTAAPVPAPRVRTRVAPPRAVTPSPPRRRDPSLRWEPFLSGRRCRSMRGRKCAPTRIR